MFIVWLTEKRFLEVSDVVVPNETELTLMCQATDVDPERDESVCAGARELIERGVSYGTLVEGCGLRTRGAAPRFRIRRKWPVSLSSVGALSMISGAARNLTVQHSSRSCCFCQAKYSVFFDTWEFFYNEPLDGMSGK